MTPPPTASPWLPTVLPSLFKVIKCQSVVSKQLFVFSWGRICFTGWARYWYSNARCRFLYFIWWIKQLVDLKIVAFLDNHNCHSPNANIMFQGIWWSGTRVCYINFDATNMAKEVGRNPIVSFLGMLSKTLLSSGSLEEHVWWIQIEYNGYSLGKFHSVYGLDIFM